MLQIEIHALYVLLPLAQSIRIHVVANRGPNLVCVLPLLAQLVRLHVAHAGPSLLFVSHSRSTDQIIQLLHLFEMEVQVLYLVMFGSIQL